MCLVFVFVYQKDTILDFKMHFTKKVFFPFFEASTKDKNLFLLLCFFSVQISQ